MNKQEVWYYKVKPDLLQYGIEKEENAKGFNFAFQHELQIESY